MCSILQPNSTNFCICIKPSLYISPIKLAFSKVTVLVSTSYSPRYTSKYFRPKPVSRERIVYEYRSDIFTRHNGQVGFLRLRIIFIIQPPTKFPFNIIIRIKSILIRTDQMVFVCLRAFFRCIYSNGESHWHIGNIGGRSRSGKYQVPESVS